MIYRSYEELSRFASFDERFKYLDLCGKVGNSTFGYDRYLNQILYKCDEWLSVRHIIIIRDDGCDLGIDEYPIFDKAIVHHMNPITIEDVENRNPIVFNPNYLILTSHRTHNAIHYGDISQARHEKIIVRTRNDTTLWK